MLIIVAAHRIHTIICRNVQFAAKRIDERVVRLEKAIATHQAERSLQIASTSQAMQRRLQELEEALAQKVEQSLKHATETSGQWIETALRSTLEGVRQESTRLNAEIAANKRDGINAHHELKQSLAAYQTELQKLKDSLQSDREKRLNVVRSDLEKHRAALDKRLNASIAEISQLKDIVSTSHICSDLSWSRVDKLIQPVVPSVAESGTFYPENINVQAPNAQTIKFVKENNGRRIAEIGIFKGHTSIEFAKHFAGQGFLHLYDFSDRAETFKKTINNLGFQNVDALGCSYKLLDSYNWSLAKQLEKHSKPIYDYIFIDGAHTWAIDGFTFYLADQLLEVGGYMDFDDYNWTLARSPSMNPTAFPLTADLYSPAQIAAPQVKMIIDLLVRRSERYREVLENKIFQKLG